MHRDDEWSWLRVDAELAARRLLGASLHRTLDGTELRARIVEVEAYDQLDPASHSYRGRTPRNAAMFLDAGHAYVYLSYGIHHCCNIVVGEPGFGAGVLIRAVEPLDGLATMRALRGGASRPNLTNGPGKVGQALALGLELSGHRLSDAPLRLTRGEPAADGDITVTTRVGISKARDARRRFYLTGHPDVSRPR